MPVSLSPVSPGVVGTETWADSSLSLHTASAQDTQGPGVAVEQ